MITGKQPLPILQPKVTAAATSGLGRQPMRNSSVATPKPLIPQSGNFAISHRVKSNSVPKAQAGLGIVQRSASSSSSSSSSSYVPPHMRGGGRGAASGGGGGGYRMPLASARHEWLRDWLEQNAANLVIVRVAQQRTDDLVEIRCAFDPGGHNRIVQYHIHQARGKRPYLGSIWMRGLHDVALNAQENPIPETLRELWRTWRRNEILFAEMNRFRGRAADPRVSPAEQAMLAARRARAEDDD